MAINRFRQYKEEEKRKKLSKALPADDIKSPESASDAEEESDVETVDKVNFSVGGIPY